MQSVFIWPNEEKPGIHEAVTEAYQLLSGCGAQVIVPKGYGAQKSQAIDAEYAEMNDGIERADFIVCLGGDGTILRIAECAAMSHKPLIGVNLGHVGFMTELERGELHKIQKILVGKYAIDSRMMLDITVMREGTVFYRQTALNDVMLLKSNPFRIIQVEIRADGVPVSSFRGDGVIIATPTGSTAYSLAAGGPIIEPSAENIAITPVCAHDLQARSFVFAPEREISIAARAPEDSGVSLSADGQGSVALRPSDRIVIRRSKLMTRLIRVKGRSFYNLLKYKLSNGGAKA